ncbi:Carboxypeptidase S1-like protein B [Cercospora zeina]
MEILALCTVCSILVSCVLAGYPSQPEGTTTRQIEGKPGGSISFKETTICETRSRAYAGYVHLSSALINGNESEDAAYNISMFFWYFEARNSPRDAQTAIYLAGGPGISSMVAATQSGGPCAVLPDANSTQSNPWAWNEFVNVLYIDQPVGTGFSYDSLINGTRNLLYTGAEDTDLFDITLTGTESETQVDEDVTNLLGTFSSQFALRTANSTAAAARTLWHFSQAWFSSFPGYTTTDKRISILGNSYGGYYVPHSAAYFQKQNERIRSGELQAQVLPINSIGWTNGCTDMLYQAEWYPDMAYNNTYTLHVLPDEAYAAAKEAWHTEGGCRDQILACREAGNTYDPAQYGNHETVNQVCLAASFYCAANIILGPFAEYSNRSAFDLSHFDPDPSPPYYSTGFFNQAWVQRDLGVPLNFTRRSYVVQQNFVTTADAFRVEGLKDIEYLLSQDIKVTMIYGDRDYRCPWNGGEELSLAAKWSGAEAFQSAGYADIKIGDCGQAGGVVRQHGNLSFSRVFQAGHDVAFSQPRTAFEIFKRSLLGLDVATGKRRTYDRYSTAGPKDSWHIRETLPEPPAFECSIFAVAESCTSEQYLALEDGSAVIENGIVIWPKAVMAEGNTSVS